MAVSTTTNHYHNMNENDRLARLEKLLMAIAKLTVSLTEMTYGVSDNQLRWTKLLSQLPVADENARQILREFVAQAETRHEQTEAFLATVKGLLKH